MHETWNSGENVENMMDTGYACLFYVFILKNESLLVFNPAGVLVCLHFPLINLSPLHFVAFCFL